MSSRGKGKVDKQMEEKISQFVGITGASTKDAKRLIEQYKHVEVAINAYYNDPATRTQSHGGASTSKLNDLFNQYKDPDGDSITVDGTIRFCQDFGVDPEDVVLLTVAYELKSPRVGEWNRQGWVDGWKALGVDTIANMKSSLLRLRDKLGSNPDYFQRVYSHTFDFAKPEGARVLSVETASAFWGLLLPHGLQGGALAHIPSKDSDDDVDMGGSEEGWQEEHTQWWFDFLNEKAGRGVSKDTWMMFLDFVRSIDSKFEKYDAEAAWPSTIDDFVEYAKGRVGSA